MGSVDSTAPSLQSSARTPEERCLELIWCWPTQGTRRDRLTGRLVIGRGPECDVRLDDAETSRRHAEIVRDGRAIRLCDCRSRNGTYLNGHRVEAAELTAGDVFRVGGSLALVAPALPLASDRSSVEFGALAKGLLGGPRLAGALAAARRAAIRSMPILVEGETGTGKERVARAIHEWSGRAGAFIAVNCAAIPEALAEAELFGYRRGAFTSAVQSSPGYVRSSDRGTLLLDEIDSLGPTLQAKLLRVLEEREVTAIGEQVAHRVDLRVIATTHEPLATAVSEGRFRADLYARLSGIVVRVPALRERLEDVPPLLAHFLDQADVKSRKVDARAVERLLQHDFPLNVRELRLIAHRLAVLQGDDDDLKLDHMLASLGDAAGGALGPSRARRKSGLSRSARRASDSEALRGALEHCSCNLRQAASMVGISRQRAYRLLGTDDRTRLSLLRHDRSTRD